MEPSDSPGTAARDPADPLLPKPRGGLRDGVLRATAKLAVRVTLPFSPHPTTMLVRKAFAAGGARSARQLAPHEPAGVAATLDERYGDLPELLLDVYRPEAAQHALPTVVWVHGGGWIGGSKDELAVYFKMIASKGYAVVAPNYSLAPGQRYPTPLRHVMEVLRYVQAHAEEHLLDATRIVVAGDSAGAQLAAQAAALVTTPGYADAVGVPATLAPEHLRGVVLACGPYDLQLLRAARSATGRRLVAAVLWSYSGRRDFAGDPAFATFSVTEHVTAAFPPALITVGNADPLRAHSELLAEKLRAVGLEPETLFFPADHTPELGHEYQFDLDSDAGRLFLDRLTAFLAERTGEGRGGSTASP